MRIIGGAFKGRTLYGFRGEDIRPTSDNARESLFNILGDLSGAEFLDLFSGTGAVGIEALSRGAAVTFNDFDRESVALTKANLERVGGSGSVYRSDALSFIKTCGRKFDYVFLDPPYKSDFIRELLDSVSSVLKAGGTVIFENERVFTGVAKGLVLTGVRRYGRAVISFFKLKQEGAAVYAGTFDPVTKGHEKSIRETVRAFGKVFAVIGDNPTKTPFFTEEERAELLSAALNNEPVDVVKYSDFKSEKEYAEFLKNSGVKYYVRGIRDEKDFAYEKKAEKHNFSVYPFITTVYLFCDEDARNISSTKVRSLIKKGVDATEFIPDGAKEKFAAFMEKRQERK